MAPAGLTRGLRSSSNKRLKQSFPMSAGTRAKTEHATRTRLIEAAGPVFASAGYGAATVRAICERAGVNVASVNYHFGDKRELYSQTLARCVQEGFTRSTSSGLPPSAAADKRLLAFVQAFLRRILVDGRPDWQGQLLAREMLDPTEAQGHVVEQVIRPLFKQLCAIVAELLGARAEPALVILCARSVIGQCLFYHHSRPLLRKLSPQESLDEDQVQRLARHIAAFSTAAMTRWPTGGIAP